MPFRKKRHFFAKELGGSIKVTGYVRYDKGEGLEKREEDFAAEIQKMVQG